MSDPLYRRELLRLAADAHGAGRLAAPDAIGTAFNPACGDKVTVYLTFENGKVKDVGFEGRGCAISMASASLMTEIVKGKTEADARAIFERFHDEMTGKSLLTSGPWGFCPSDVSPPSQAALEIPQRRRGRGADAATRSTPH